MNTLKENIITVYIKTTYHNTFISIVKKNKILKTFSCGLLGFKHKKKSTSFVSVLLANKCSLYMLSKNISYIHIIFKGLNIFKKIILNSIINFKYNKKFLKILSIKDITSYPYNGCRSKKIKKR